MPDHIGITSSASTAHRARIAPFVLEANEQNLDRLAAEVRNVA